MRGYILFLVLVSCTIQAMYDSSKRLKLTDSTESVKHTPLQDLVRQSQVYKAFHEDTGASCEECLELMTTPEEQVLLESYAIQKEKDPSSLVARSYKALGISQLGTLANAANKLDMQKTYHEILDDLGQKINDLTQKKESGQLDQLQSLDTDARGELGKRMSLDLLAHLKIVSFSLGRMPSRQNVIESDWFSLLKYNNYFPIKKKIFQLDCKKILDCTLAADSKSIIAVVKNQNNNMESLLIDSATGKQTSLKEEKYRSKYEVVASPDGASHIFNKKPSKRQRKEQPESEDEEHDLVDLPKASKDITEGMRELKDWSRFTPDGVKYFQVYTTKEEDGEGFFSVVSCQDGPDAVPIFIKEKFAIRIQEHLVSTFGRFCAISTFVPFDLEEQLGDNGCIYLYDSHTHKKHIVHGKNIDERFNVQNVSFDDHESIMIVTTDAELFVLDVTKSLPEIVDIQQHAVEHHEIIQDYDYLNYHQTQPFITQWRVDQRLNTAVGLFKNNEYLLTLAQNFKTKKDEVKNMPHRELCHDDTHIELADMSPAYDYIKTITSMTPQQAALVSSLIKQNESMGSKISKAKRSAAYGTHPLIEDAISLNQQEMRVYESLHEDIKRHLLKKVKLAGIRL